MHNIIKKKKNQQNNLHYSIKLTDYATFQNPRLPLLDFLNPNLTHRVHN